MGVGWVPEGLGGCKLGACDTKWAQAGTCGTRWVKAGCLLGHGALGIQKERSGPLAGVGAYVWGLLGDSDLCFRDVPWGSTMANIWKVLELKSQG